MKDNLKNSYLKAEWNTEEKSEDGVGENGGREKGNKWPEYEGRERERTVGENWTQFVFQVKAPSPSSLRVHFPDMTTGP